MLTLGGLACWDDMQNLLKSKSNTQLIARNEFEDYQLVKVNQIKEALHKFSFSKYCVLAKRPEMLNIMTYFINQTKDSLSHDERIGFQILFDKCIH